MPYHALGKVRRAGLIALLVLGWGPAAADRAIAAVTITQITSGGGFGGGFEATISGDGNTIVFDSKLNLSGENSTGMQEIFAYDVGQKTFTQVTHTSNPNFFNFAPVADRHATKIAYFVDKQTMTGTKDPIFLFDKATSTSVKVADDARTAQRITISGNGSRLYFISTKDLIAGSNTDKNDELFVYRTSTHTLRQVTHSTSPQSGLTKFDPWVSRNGKSFVLASTDDIGGNGPNNDGEVFFGTLPLAGSHLQQITTLGGASNIADESSISADGRWIAFRSEEDLVAGENSDHNQEIFLFDVATSTMTQVTQTVANTGAGSVLPVVNGDGSRILFASNANLDPSVGNADKNFEFFVFDKGTSTFTQITKTVTGSPDTNLNQGNPSFSDDGKRAVFVTNADLVGKNSAHAFEVFLATIP